ncbi:hypothetical protein ACFVHB_04810 [Kitasatospora sp. NPDC127111]|uniref:hypothetical protein n=1 Tax=Kitasatospora sp. NPDC127111 TaxID=3345363 RepID=UPI00362F42C8
MTTGLSMAGVLALYGLAAAGVRLLRDLLVLRRLERLMTGCTAPQRAEVGKLLAASLRPADPAPPGGGAPSADGVGRGPG